MINPKLVISIISIFITSLITGLILEFTISDLAIYFPGGFQFSFDLYNFYPLLLLITLLIIGLFTLIFKAVEKISINTKTAANEEVKKNKKPAFKLFEKRKNITIWPVSWSYFNIREFEFEKENSKKDYTAILGDFMRTKYVIWKEEFQNEAVVIDDKILDWNFHGLYDIKKLNTQHFKNVTADFFIQRFKNFIRQEIETDPKTQDIHTELDRLKDLNAAYFIMNISEKEKDELLHPETVFDFFLSGFIINKIQNKIIIVEFGLD